jgi:bifunctional DNA-binding transcriptional regulator/antitoxin component of YhaV-PrlF toxin-antitoxin module
VTTYTVQECGCIALPEELQRRTGLYPGAIFEFEVAEDGSRVTLASIQRTQSKEPASGAHCGEISKK